MEIAMGGPHVAKSAPLVVDMQNDFMMRKLALRANHATCPKQTLICHF